MMTPELLEKMHRAALAARDNSYSPYSRFRVGAALLLANGEIIGGCNVENSSFGATICAERTAFAAATARFGELKPEALVLATDPAAVPCGLCLQVMAEFCSPDFPVYLGTPESPGRRVALRDLLPIPFTPDALK